MEERKIAINPCPLGDEEILSFYSIIFLLFLSGSLATFIRHQTLALARSPVGVQIQTDQDNVSQRSTRARVTDRPTDRPVTHLLSPDSVSRSAPRVCLPSSSFVAVAVCLVTRMSFLATCRPQLSAVSQSHLATSVRLFIFFSVSSA